MTTRYDFEGETGPIVPQIGGRGRMRVTHVVVTSHDNGHTDVTAKGYSITKDGKRKSNAWMLAELDIDDAFARALAKL